MTLEDVINEKVKYSNVTRSNFGEHSAAELMSKEFIRNMNVRRRSLAAGKIEEDLKDFNPSLPPARVKRPSDDEHSSTAPTRQVTSTAEDEGPSGPVKEHVMDAGG